MTDFNIVSTETWRIHLPSDWSKHGRSTEHTAYFESADGTKGTYLSSWCFPNDKRLVREILESFRRVELCALHDMKDSVWQSVDEWGSERPEFSVLGTDYLDRRARYRIVCQLISRLPWLVRSTFHDYDCNDYEISKRFFQPIVESLRIHNHDP